MTLETWFVLACVALAVSYFARNIYTGFKGTGGCASGCGSCGAKACPAKRLEALRKPV